MIRKKNKESVQSNNLTLRYNENEIRHDIFVKEDKINLLQDAGRLLTKIKNFVLVNCPACNLKLSKFAFEKNGFTYNNCLTCDTMYINPRPSLKILEWYYKESVQYKFFNKFIFPASEEIRHNKIFIPRVNKVIELCKKYKIKKDSILEVGAGFGNFCIELKKRKVFNNIIGVELTPDLAETCRKKGINILEDAIENINFNKYGQFNVVASFEVVEHLFSPRNFFLHCRKCIKKNGILILTCPNGKGFDISILGKISDNVDFGHLNYFNPYSLSLLLKNCGFEVIELNTPGQLDAELVRKKVISKEFDISNQPFLKYVLIDNWEKLRYSFQDFIASNGLSSNILIVARKT